MFDIQDESEEEQTKLTVKQVEVANLILEGKTLSQVVEASGVPKSTITSWRKLPIFKDYINEALKEIRADFIAQLHLSLNESVNTLRALIVDRGTNASVRLNAAKAIIEYTMKYSVETVVENETGEKLPSFSFVDPKTAKPMGLRLDNGLPVIHASNSGKLN